MSDPAWRTLPSGLVVPASSPAPKPPPESQDDGVPQTYYARMAYGIGVPVVVKPGLDVMYVKHGPDMRGAFAELVATERPGSIVLTEDANVPPGMWYSRATPWDESEVCE